MSTCTNTLDLLSGPPIPCGLDEGHELPHEHATRPLRWWSRTQPTMPMRWEGDDA